MGHLRLLESNEVAYTPENTSKPPLSLMITSIGLSTSLRVLAIF